MQAWGKRQGEVASILGVTTGAAMSEPCRPLEEALRKAGPLARKVAGIAEILNTQRRGVQKA